MSLDPPNIHSLSLVRVSRNYAWFSPAELGADAAQDVGFAAPVDGRRHFRRIYQFDVFQYENPGGPPSVGRHDLVADGDGTFALDLDGRVVRFREKRRGAVRRSFRYAGRYLHRDFHSRLVEIEPEDHAILDRLCLDRGYVLIGCDPSENYAGWTDQSARGQEPGIEGKSARHAAIH